MPRRLSPPIAPIILTLTAVIAPLSGCSSTGKPADIDATADAGAVRVYEVFGMGCPGCQGGLEDLALEKPAIAHASASWKENTLTLRVTGSAELTDDEVFAVIEKANLTPGKRVR